MLPDCNAKALMLAIEHSAHFVMHVNECLLNDCDYDVFPNLLHDPDQTYEEFCMLQLCEQTRREIVKRVEPSTKSEIAQRLAQKDTEAALITDAKRFSRSYGEYERCMSCAHQGKPR